MPGVPKEGSSFITDRSAIVSILGDLPETTPVIKATSSQLREMEISLGLESYSLGAGSVIRQFDNIQDLSPTSPLEGNQFFRGPGFHLPGGAPEITISPAQSRINNQNVVRSWIIEVSE